MLNHTNTFETEYYDYKQLTLADEKFPEFDTGKRPFYSDRGRVFNDKKIEVKNIRKFNEILSRKNGIPDIKMHQNKKWIQNIRKRKNFSHETELKKNNYKIANFFTNNAFKLRKNSRQRLKHKHQKLNKSMLQEIMNEIDEFEVKYAERINK